MSTRDEIDEASSSLNASGGQQTLNRACESCRSLKVRCLMDVNSTKCQRCTKANRSCVFATTQRRRKPRKRVDVRVAELERELDSLRSLLKATRVSHAQHPVNEGHTKQDRHRQDVVFNDLNDATPIPSGGDANDEDPGVSQRHLSSSVRHFAKVFTEYRDARELPTLSDAPCTGGIDPIDKDIISYETASRLLVSYSRNCVPHFPAVMIPQNLTVSEFRRSRPILFLAVMAAAALGGDNAKETQMLNDELLRVLAVQVMVNGGKSLELVQALLVSVAFYNPPGPPSRLQFHQFAFIASTMALDTGLGSEPDTTSNEDTAERCRAILGCFLVSSTTSMKLCRPPILSFNSWMATCLKMLKSSSSLLDRRLAASVEIQRLLEEGTASFGFDDPGSGIGLADFQVQVIVKRFERQMEDLKQALDPEVMNETLRVGYYQAHATGYENFMMDDNVKMDRFNRKHFGRVLDPCWPRQQSRPSAKQINALIKRVNASHTILDLILDMETATLKNAPSDIYSCAAYSLMTLLKVFFRVEQLESDFQDIASSLNLDSYIEKLRQKWENLLGGPCQRRLPGHWLSVLSIVETWKRQHQEKMKLLSSQDSQMTSSQSATSQESTTKQNTDPVTTSSQEETPSFSASTGSDDHPAYDWNYGIKEDSDLRGHLSDLPSSSTQERPAQDDLQNFHQLDSGVELANGYDQTDPFIDYGTDSGGFDLMAWIQEGEAIENMIW